MSNPPNSQTQPQEPALVTPLGLQRQIKRRSEYLENLENQIALSEMELVGIQNQITAAKKRKEGIIAEIQAEAAARRLEAETELKQRLSDINQAIQIQEEKHKTLDEKLSKTQENISHSERERDSLQDDINNLNGRIADAEKNILTLSRKLEEQEFKIKQAEDEVLGLEQQAQELRDTIGELTKQKEAVQVEIDVKQAENSTIMQKFETQRAEAEEKLQQTELRLEQRIKQLKDIASTDKVMREELANERLRLDKLDKSLRARELSVRQGESKLQENAELLNL